MQEFVRRLIRCGFPRKIALFMCVKRKGNMPELEKYVEEIEQASTYETEEKE